MRLCPVMLYSFQKGDFQTSMHPLPQPQQREDSSTRSVQRVTGHGVKCDRNNDIQAEQHGAFEVVRFTVQNCICDHKHRNEERDSFDCSNVSAYIPGPYISSSNNEEQETTYKFRIGDPSLCPLPSREARGRVSLARRSAHSIRPQRPWPDPSYYEQPQRKP